MGLGLGLWVEKGRPTSLLWSSSSLCGCRVLIRLSMNQVATGLPVRIAAPTERNPGRMVHLREHLRRAVSAGPLALAAASTVHWASADALHELVTIGLECCAEEPDDRLLLRGARSRLAPLLHPATTGSRGEAGAGGGGGEASTSEVSTT